MDVYTTIDQSLGTWDKDGQTTCRAVLASPLCSLSDPSALECIDVVTTVYQTLLHATLSSWPTHHKITVASLISFTQAVLNDLPSSSSASQKSTNLVRFGELLVDVVWAVDSELDEIVGDAKALVAAANETATLPSQGVSGISKEKLEIASKAKATAEGDKEVLASFITKLLITGIVEPANCRERLDGALLAMARLIPDKTQFEKKEIRTKTALFYKQNKFNLLREQSEGYTKLTTDLMSSLGPPHVASTGLPSESFDAIEARAQAVWERVLSFIGCFDLDPNRALDIILDVFSVNIAAHWQFFLSLLSYSPWVGGFGGFGRVKDEPMEGGVDADAEGDGGVEVQSVYRGKEMDEILKMVEGEGVGKKSAAKDTHVLAQVLGFKFGYYQLPDVFEICPKSLYLTAALLIRYGFVSLEELYPHLGPSDEDMTKYRRKYLDKVQARVNASATNALAMAAALESGPPPNRARAPANGPAAEEPEKPVPVKEDEDQKGKLCIALLSVGAIRPAFAIMSKFQWMVDAYPEIADLVIRMLKASIEPLYQAVHGNKERNMGFLQPRPRYAPNGLQKPQPRKPILTLVAPTPPGTHVVDYVFFYPHWSERVPICNTRDDLEDVVEPIIRLIGFHISREPLFITKLARVGRVHLAATVKQDEQSKKQMPISALEHPTQAFWFHMLRKYLLPALTMVPGNAVCTVEVWNILKQFETTVRWQLYGEWRDVMYRSHPELRAQHTLREREAKGILRRLSSQTVDSLSGTVAKMAHSNPCIFFTNAVSQIQAYENLADVVIQALRHSTNMGFDILVFITLDAMANPNKERVKEDGVYTSDWLQNLATFVGSLYKRYNSDITPVLKYIVHQLYNSQTTEIIVLEKLVLKMAGIEPLPTLSDAQIVAMAGGPTLRVEAVASELRGAGFDVSDAHLKGTPRLGKGLVESGLAFPLLVQVEQQRQACVFRTNNAHLKSMAYLFDSTHGVLFQYLDLLMTPSAVSFEDYCKILPPLRDLINLYGVSVPVAMHILRPMLNNAVLKRATEWKASIEAAKAKSAEDAEKRLKAALAAKREPSAVAAPVAESNGVANGSSDTNGIVPSESATQPATEAMDVDTTAETNPTSEVPWLPELFALFDDIKQIAPGSAYEVIGPGLYTTFWQMSSYDLYLPKEKYIETEKTLDNNARSANRKYIDADRSSDRSLRAMASTHRNQRERYHAAIQELQKERAVQELVHKFTTGQGGRLDREKAHWLAHVGQEGGVKILNFVPAFLEHCILPRCLLSPMDADYCVRLLKALHEWGTPGWHTLMLYDRILHDLVKNIVFSCSENEARNFGRFLKGILQDLYVWYMDEKAFDASCRREVDGTVKFLPGLSKPFLRDGPANADGLLKWQEFKSFLRKCHRRIGNSFTECIQAGDFMHVYNTVLVLKEILEVFPVATVNEVVGSSIDFEITKLINSEERGDLKILARAYSAGLKKREEFWISPKTKVPIVAPKAATPVPRAPAAEKLREPPSSSTTAKADKPATAPESIPSAPRNAQNIPQAPANKNAPQANPTKLALDSIPKPEVVKRVRQEARGSERPSPTPSQEPEPMQVDKPTSSNQNPLVKATDTRPTDAVPVSTRANATDTPAKMDVVSNLRKEAQQAQNTQSRPASPSLVHSPRMSQPQRVNEEAVQRADSAQSMPPPTMPSQTLPAQELRATARQPTGTLTPTASNTELRLPHLEASHLRSSSPASRPGTRNHSADSRESGDRRSRSERDTDRDEDGRRGAGAESLSRVERSERAERSGGAHRDVLHVRSERNGRERIPGSSLREAERERDSDRGDRRDRGEKDKDRDRERERERDRDRRRDREREPSHRERDREREKEGDRHRRDERERDREQRRDTKVSGTAQREPDAQADHGSSRSDTVRHRSGAHGGSEDSLGKRRRAAEDEPLERSSKRNSRRQDYREDRTRRTEKESSREHTRESDRRRKERDGPEADMKALNVDKSLDRSSRLGETAISPASNKSSGPPPPSAPRAMSSTSPGTNSRHELPPTTTNSPRERERERDRNDRNDDRSEHAERTDRSDRDWKTNRESGGGQHPHRGTGSAAGAVNGSVPPGSAQVDGSNSTASTPAPPASNSLRSRISDYSSPSGSSRVYASRGQEEHGDARKRTAAERERDALLDAPLSAGSAPPNSPSGTMKRPRINRTRYQEAPSSLAQRVLTSTGHASGRSHGGGGGGGSSK